MTLRTPPVVDPAWLGTARGVVLADCRAYLDGRSGREAYAGGHLPGAVHVDLELDLSGEGAGRHPLPSPEAFAAALGRLGIASDATVVAYDDAGGVIAARLVWMLRATGHEAGLLDGGLREDGTASRELTGVVGGLTRTVPAYPAVERVGVPWPVGLLATLEQALQPGRVLLDARPADRYAGLGEDPLDPRSGHVPGARSLPCRENVDAEGRLLPVEVLRQRYTAVGAGGGVDVVASCGSGVTACHLLLAREHAGLGTGRLWVGSWSEYSATDLPAETGAAAAVVATGTTPT